MDADPMTAQKVFGLFPVNLLHNGVHLLFGLWGLLAARSFASARSYAIIGGLAYLALACLGFVSPSLFGLVPIGGNDISLHALIGVVLAVVGFTAKQRAVTA